MSRVSVYDLSVEHEDIEYCCVVANGGNFQKFIDLAQNHKVIAVNGCDNCCPETILKTKNATVEYNLNVNALLRKHDLKVKEHYLFLSARKMPLIQPLVRRFPKIRVLESIIAKIMNN